jgi:putative phosphoesterase
LAAPPSFVHRRDVNDEEDPLAGRAAVLADAHGNSVALAAVLREVAEARPDLLVFVGDLKWGPLSEDTCALMSAVGLPVIYVRGNAERALAEATSRFAAGDGASLTPRERWLVERHTPAMHELLARCRDSEERVLVTAHTHLQFDREVAGIRSVNPGSVGMPYGARPGVAYWALLGPKVELRQTEYDLGDPLADKMVEILVSPPTHEEIVAHAEKAELSG